MTRQFIPTPLQENKYRMRAEMREKRRMNAVDTDSKTNDLANVFIENIQLSPVSIIASYNAVRSELDPTALDEALRQRGHKIALPIIIRKKQPLIFRLYEPGDRLLANPLGILEPASTAEGTEPDILLIPLLAFDRKRNRLGYGGGYYDRTIKKLRLRKPLRTIGIGFSFQEVEEVPIGINDVQLDMIVTEREAF